MHKDMSFCSYFSVQRHSSLFICACTETAFSSYVHVQRLHSLQMSMYKRHCFFFINPHPRTLHTHCLLISTHKDLPPFTFQVWGLVHCHSIHISTHMDMPHVFLFMLPGTQTPILFINPWTTTLHSLHSYMNKSTASCSRISTYMYRDTAFT